MTKLPVISGRECARALEKVGFRLRRHKATSHMVLVRDNPRVSVSVPDHKEVDRGTLRAIIRQAGLTVDEFAELLD